jgi:SET domain-containing protein
MLTIPTYLAESGVHGIGLYAAEAVKAGDKVWEFNHEIDFVYDSQWMGRLVGQSLQAFDYFCQYAYKRDNRYYYVSDNARFINHSQQANIGFGNNGDEIALQDINPGDELLENYLLAYDVDDCFSLEMYNVDLRHYFSLHESKRKEIVDGIFGVTAAKAGTF